MNDIEQLLRGVGKTLKKHSGSPSDVRQKSSSPADAVTELDIWAEQEIIQALEKITPHVPVVGEETGGNVVHENFWTLDPIDGTGYFVRGAPFSMTMLARIEGAVVQESYLYNFSTDEFFEAHKKGGAYKNGTPLNTTFSKNTLGYVEIESNISKGLFSKIAEQLHAHNYVSQKIIVAGFLYALIAEGKLDAYLAYEPYGKLYDYAPGSLLVEEAGGIVKNIGTSSPYNVFNYNFIAGNPSVVEALMAPNGPLAFLETHQKNNVLE